MVLSCGKVLRSPGVGRTDEEVTPREWQPARRPSSRPPALRHAVRQFWGKPVQLKPGAGPASRCGHPGVRRWPRSSDRSGRVWRARRGDRRPRCSAQRRGRRGGAHGGAGFRRPRAARWRSRAAPPRSLARQLAAAWRVVTAAAGGQRLPGAAGRRAAALRGDGFPRLRPARAAAVPREKDKDTPVRNGANAPPSYSTCCKPKLSAMPFAPNRWSVTRTQEVQTCVGRRKTASRGSLTQHALAI